MDIVSHAIAGAATGALWGHPVAGAVAAVLPDIVIAGPRRALPSTLYRFTHSYLAFLIVSLLVLFIEYNLAAAIALAYLSHLWLDAVTHGEQWAPRFLWPLEMVCFKNIPEWEFGNRTWWLGLLITIVYSLTCFTVAYA